MRVDTQSQVFVFRSVVDDAASTAAEPSPSPAMAAAMAWSTPLPLHVPSTATSIRPMPLADLRLLTAYAHEPPQLRDASLVPPPPVAVAASLDTRAKKSRTAKPSFTKAAKAARASSRPPATSLPRSRVSALAHAMTLAAPYVAVLVVFGVAQAKWASDAWTGMRETDAIHLLTRAVPPASPSTPLPAVEAAAEANAPAPTAAVDDEVASAPPARVAPRGKGSRTTPSRAPRLP